MPPPRLGCGIRVHAERERLVATGVSKNRQPPPGNALSQCSVSLSANGDTWPSGSVRRIEAKGALYVFTRSSAAWAQQARLQPATLDPQDSMGCWVAISDDGNTVAAGALDEDTLTPGINAVKSGDSGRDRCRRTIHRECRARVRPQQDNAWTEQANFKASTSAETTGWAYREPRNV